MNEVQFILDSNALVRIGSRGRTSNLFANQCFIPSVVLEEVSGFPDIHALRQREYVVSIGVLLRLSEIMSTLVPGDSGLIDLYRNLGRADPVLIACALYEMEKSAETLFPQDWQVVSDDTAVRMKAEQFGVACLSSEEFKTLI